jgi:hypothetical protein
MSTQTRNTTRLAAATWVFIGFGIILRADEVEVIPNGRPATLSNVKVISATDSQVTIRTPAGGEAVQPRSPVSRLLLDDEPDWNAAEQAGAVEQWDAATDAYLKTLRTTQKPWLKTRVSLRLLDVAAKAKRYDAVVTAYLSLVRTDPAQALAHRPTLPEAHSSYVDSAVAAADRALAEPNLTDDQKQSLLSLQLDLHRVRKDDARADQVLRQLNELTASPAGGPPGAARRFADTKLTAARLSYDRKDYEAVIATITTARPAITDPAQQEDALYLLAQSLDARAAAAGNPPDALKDAGLAYMRVVAHFQDLPANRRVADALAGCASVLERLKQTKIAADLYEQAAIQYHTRPESRTARDRAGRLRGARPTDP